MPARALGVLLLTEKAVLAAVPRAAAYKVPDSGGLYLHVSAAGTRGSRSRWSWRAS